MAERRAGVEGGTVMAHDLGAITRVAAADATDPAGPDWRNQHGRDVLALVAAVRWAQDAPHHLGCPAGDVIFATPFPCTCGRDEAIGPFGGDRG